MQSVKAFKCIQNNKTFYFCILNSTLLKNNCFISRREENVIDGFQRTLNETRANNIAKYLDFENGVIPSSIVLSAQSNSDFNYDEVSSTINFSNSEKNFLILDGQHRLFGLYKSSNSYDIPVIIFESLTLKDEVSLFIDINTTQKGVPQTLLLDIKYLAKKQTPLEEKQAELLKRLNTNSPLMGKFATTKSTRGKISNIVFNDFTKKIFTDSIFKDRDIEHIYKALNNYLIACEYILTQSNSENIDLSKQVIFKSFMNLFEQVTQECLTESNNLKVNTIIEKLSFVSNIDFNKYSGSDNKTMILLTNQIRVELNKTKSNLLENEDVF